MNTDIKLLNDAIDASKKAYAPYSKFHVGSAVLLKNGKVITGSNVENAAYSLTNCAERSALFHIYSKGYRKEDIKKIAVYANTENFITPCGACRQVMSELIAEDCPIILSNKNKETKTLTINDLLPYAFKL